MGKTTMSAACVSPPKTIRAAWCSAPRTEVGRVTVKSMTATIWEATMPDTGPMAHAMPASSVQAASRTVKTAWWAMAV